MSSDLDMSSHSDSSDDENYKHYNYDHYSLHSKPAITNATINYDVNDVVGQKIAKLLDFVNNNPNITNEQLKGISIAINNRINTGSRIKQQLKTQYYLDKPTENKTQRVSFSSSTKLGGKTKKGKKSRKTRKNKRSRH